MYCSTYNGGLQGRIEQQAAAETGGAGDLECIKVGTWRWKERESMLAAVFQAPPRRAHRKLDANTGVVQTSLQEVLNAYSLSKILR